VRRNAGGGSYRRGGDRGDVRVAGVLSARQQARPAAAAAQKIDEEYTRKIIETRRTSGS
jgi:hypothetical protein